MKLDIDENPVTASRYDVLSIPTVILFEDGEAQETVVGARPAEHFREAFAAYLSALQPRTRARQAPEVLPAARASYGSPSEQQRDALALPRRGRRRRSRPASLDRREQLVVLAEAEVVDRRAVGERDAVEVDHAADARAAREVAGVDGDPVRDVEHRVRVAAEAPALLEAQRRPDVRAARGTRRPRRRAGR